MTKNNLAVHLKWLLKQGPSLYPSLTSESPPVERDDRVSQQPTPPSDKAEPLEAILEDDDDVTGEDMARLMLAPSSASKPRMLSRPDLRPESTPATAKKLSSSTSVIRGMWQTTLQANKLFTYLRINQSLITTNRARPPRLFDQR